MLLCVVVLAVCWQCGAVPPVCPAGAGGACRALRGSSFETQFYIHNKSMVISHVAGESLTVKCQGADLSDLSALPTFRHERAVVRVLWLHACPLPHEPLHLVLRALNATLYCARPDALPCTLQLAALPPEPALTAAHFARLEHLERLELEAEHAAPARPMPGFLAPLTSLRRLALRHVALPAAEVPPPPALRHLELTHAEESRLPPAWLDALEVLSVDSAAPLHLQHVPRAATNLTLLSPATDVSLDAMPALLSLNVDNWIEEAPLPLASCPELRDLVLTRPALRSLPAGWLRECKQLERLSLDEASSLQVLPPELLAGTGGLRALHLRKGTLRELPVGESGLQLLDHVGALRELDLSDNNLQHMPSGTFSVAKQLRKLVLSGNNLTEDALRALQSLEHLEELDLSYNSNLRDFCSSRLDMSPLHIAKGLKRLILEGTGASLVCRDWCQHMPHLERLNLKHTQVSELWFQDVRCKRQALNALVDLRGAPVSLLYTNVTDYERAGNGSGTNYAEVQLDSTMSCDCNMYWTRRAEQALKHVKGLRCADGVLRDVALQYVAPDTMQCAAPAMCADFPAACACRVRPVSDPRSSTLLVTVQCERAGLTRVPAPRARHAHRYRLLLAHNNITQLAATDLFDEIEDLDLSNNGLTAVNASAAARLAHLPGTLQLAGNPLQCSCHAAPLLRALHARPAELPRLECSDGSPLEQAAVADCPPPMSVLDWRVAAALATLLALALVVLVALASRERRFFLKAVLLRWGLLWRGAEPAEDAARPYDAFVTFSHEDEAAALQLVARLEPAYRLCVHYRDWTPGRLIAEQVLESVQRSRRTLALVSRHFLASAWACAEFQSAHEAALRDARHRLVVVLLEAPEELPQDARLHKYLATNTYVRWEDPWLWDKLRVALPPPRAPTCITPEPTVSRNPTPPKPSAFPTCISTVPNVSPDCISPEPNVVPTCASPDLNKSSTNAVSESNVSPSEPNMSLNYARPESHVSPTCGRPESNVAPPCVRPESNVAPSRVRPESNESSTCARPVSNVSPTCARPESDVSPRPESDVSPTCARPESDVSPTCAPCEPRVLPTHTPLEVDSAVPSSLGAEPNLPNVDSLANENVTYIAPASGVSRGREFVSPHLKSPIVRGVAESVVLDLPSLRRPPAPRALALAT